jgi:DHA3 family tetracycline resistance protein-like MFS transporter
MFANQRRRRFSALTLYLVLEGVSALLFQAIVTIYVVYYARTAQLDALQIVLVGTVFEATIFLFEIPTGVVADVYSRRRSVIIGVALTGLALLVEGAIPRFSAILLAEIVAGIGATFLSGATEAWIADEIGEARAAQAFVRAAQVRLLAGMAGIVVSVALASAALSLPILAAGGLFLLLALFLALFMPEDGFRPLPAAERQSWRVMVGTLRASLKLIRLRPALVFILAAGVAFAFHSEGFDHLWQKFLLDDFTLPALGALDPVVWFGVIGLGANALGLLASEIARRRLRRHTAPRLLLLIYALQSAAILAFSAAGSFWLALAAYWVIMALRSAAEPLNTAWLNRQLDPSTRATMFSVAGQVGALGEIAGGPPVGLVARAFSLRAALGATGAVLALALLPLAAAVRRDSASGSLDAG